MSDPAEPPRLVTAPAPENLWAEIAIAVSYLTRFNLPYKDEARPELVRRSMLWFPVVGVLIGLAGAALDWILSAMRMPGIITATAAVVGMLFLTRAQHEEEFAALIDRYGATLDKTAPVGWLKEARSVPYGTLGVIMLIIVKIGAIASLADNTVVFQALIVSAAWSRALMVLTAAWLAPLEGDPVADRFQQPPATRAVGSVAIGIAVSWAVLGSDAASILTASSIAALIAAILGAHYLRGYNGALIGAIQQVAEVTVLGMVLAIQ